MEGEQFSLCWNNFHSNLSSGFHALYKEEDLVDVTLAAEGRFIKAHKTVLSVCSPYFKDLFRVNPCKHPIVILQDVDYEALCNLLQFMYQGQVSVSQEEIPVFMKLAETLKVKGLTDNGSSKVDPNAKNGSNDSNSSEKNTNAIKKPIRPLKRPIRSSRPVPSGSPIQSLTKSPLPASSTPSSTPPAKRMHIREQVTTKQGPASQSNIQQKPRPSINKADSEENLIVPKMEPMDDDDSTQQSFDEENFDVNTMLAQSLDAGENSVESVPSGYASENVKPPDTSSPGEGELIFLRSGKGQLVLIHDNQMYTLGQAKDNKYKWVCVKKKTWGCRGSLFTTEGPMLLSQSVHNHPQLHDVINKLQVPPLSPMTALKVTRKI